MDALVAGRGGAFCLPRGDRRLDWAAAEHYGSAATARPAGTYARIVAPDLVAGAEMHLKRGGIEEACATWHQTVDDMAGVRSVRTRKAVSRMRSDLARFRAPPAACAAWPSSTSAAATFSPASESGAGPECGLGIPADDRLHVVRMRPCQAGQLLR
ncbi:hypothetical protein [Streptomyces sp. NPDC001678]|uniref:hypothetical protein n=1 Tax=Streptomyces sp. NPDC001678 TaxID=3364599 RepID=UPI0036AC1365